MRLPISTKAHTISTGFEPYGQKQEPLLMFYQIMVGGGGIADARLVDFA
jgi:hypothetical protein